MPFTSELVDPLTVLIIITPVVKVAVFQLVPLSEYAIEFVPFPTAIHFEKVGFEKLNHSLGNSGHCGCDIWMLKKLH